MPSSEYVSRGLQGSDDPAAHGAVIDAGLTRLSERVRAIADWYATYEDFHVQYKHGLKLAMRPYGNPTPEAIAERRSNVRGGLLAFTSEPVTQLLKAPQQQQGMIFPNLIPEARAHLKALVERRAILRYKQSGPEVDLDEVAIISGTVAQLLRIAAVNRLAISTGLDEHGLYHFDLPGTERYELVSVALGLQSAPSLDVL